MFSQIFCFLLVLLAGRTEGAEIIEHFLAGDDAFETRPHWPLSLPAPRMAFRLSRKFRSALRDDAAGKLIFR